MRVVEEADVFISRSSSTAGFKALRKENASFKDIQTQLTVQWLGFINASILTNRRVAMTNDILSPTSTLKLFNKRYHTATCHCYCLFGNFSSDISFPELLRTTMRWFLRVMNHLFFKMIHCTSIQNKEKV